LPALAFLDNSSLRSGGGAPLPLRAMTSSPAAPAAAIAADHALAHLLASQAGQLLVDLRAKLHAEGVEGKELKDAGDMAAHNHLMEALRTERPNDAVLSEEGKDDKARLDAERTWIIDPLDGTREFSEPPRDDWAVHVALVIDGQPVAGAVALPAQGITLSTHTKRLAPGAPGDPLRFVASRTRPGPSADLLVDHLGATMIPMGSAGAKTMAVVQGRADIYAHTGGQYEWDSCAPVAVANAAGLHTSRIDGSPLVYNNDDVYLPDLLVCRTELADQVLTILANLADA